MSVQTEKSLLIDLLQNINDASIIQKVKNFVLHEIEPLSLSENQKKELDKRLAEHQENPKSGVDAFDFLDSLKSKYEL
jgi:putative addiction module component (TIGR02574 family)